MKLKQKKTSSSAGFKLKVDRYPINPLVSSRESSKESLRTDPSPGGSWSNTKQILGDPRRSLEIFDDPRQFKSNSETLGAILKDPSKSSKLKTSQSLHQQLTILVNEKDLQLILNISVK